MNVITEFDHMDFYIDHMNAKIDHTNFNIDHMVVNIDHMNAFTYHMNVYIDHMDFYINVNTSDIIYHMKVYLYCYACKKAVCKPRVVFLSCDYMITSR